VIRVQRRKAGKLGGQEAGKLGDLKGKKVRRKEDQKLRKKPGFLPFPFGLYP
jgi:hypothetical protein